MLVSLRSQCWKFRQNRPKNTGDVIINRSIWLTWYFRCKRKLSAAITTKFKSSYLRYFWSDFHDFFDATIREMPEMRIGGIFRNRKYDPPLCFRTWGTIFAITVLTSGRWNFGVCTKILMVFAVRDVGWPRECFYGSTRQFWHFFCGFIFLVFFGNVGLL